MKLSRVCIALVALSCLFAYPTFAAEKAKTLTCCQEAAAQGKDCRHKCCLAAHRESKSCTKCNPNKEDLKSKKSATSAPVRN